MLILPIRKKWFDMILSGQKKEEYREIKPYYDIRFGNEFFGHRLTPEQIKALKRYMTLPTEVAFRNGYSKNSLHIKCWCRLTAGQGKEEWGAEPNKEYYILEILEILDYKEEV